jgi:hypothetical protein
MAKEQPPLLFFGKEPTAEGLNFDDILASMGVGNLNLDSDSNEESKAPLKEEKRQKTSSDENESYRVKAHF